MAETKFTPAVNVKAIFHIGDRMIKKIVLKQNGEDLDSVTGWTWEFIIKKNKGDRVNVVRLTLDDGLSYEPYTSFTLVIDLSAYRASIEEGEYFWELRRTDISSTWITGPAIFDYTV